MGRTPCCTKVGLRRGVWTALEDKILTNYIKIHGEGRWRNVPKEAGLKRCGKSCRLRWINYLRPDIKRGNISPEEEDLILKLHGLLGNRWSLIAGRLPGRTDNEIKNYWNTNLRKKVNDGKQSSKLKDEEKPKNTLAEIPIPSSNMVTSSVIRPKAFKYCSKQVLITTPQPYKVDSLNNNMLAAAEYSSMDQEYLVNNTTLMESKSSDLGADNSSNFSSIVGELLTSNSEYLSDQSDHFWEVCEFDNVIEENGNNNIDGTNDDQQWPSWDLCNFENVIEEEGNIISNGGTNNDDPPQQQPSMDNYLLFLDEILQD